jgi:hypothetical protein
MQDSAGQEGREEGSGDALHWLAQGLLVAPCIMWWGVAHAEDILGALRIVKPDEPIFSTDYVFQMVLFVWLAAASLAVWMFLVLWRLRRNRIDGRSKASWAYFGLGLASLACVLISGRDVRGKPMTIDMWMVYVACAALFGRWFLARRTASRQ